jgi:uncharacterized protein YacL
MGKLRNNSKVDVVIYDGSISEVEPDAPVDQRLLALATDLGGRVLTNDHNLNRVAELRGVEVVNLNDLSNAIKPVVLPGEKMRVRLVKAGESVGQGVGYLDDGTMVVVEQGRAFLNQEVELIVTSALQTSAGRMIFGRIGDAGGKAAEENPSAGRISHPKPQPT